MTRLGEMNRSITLRRRDLDDNDERTGPWREICTRDARVTPKLGGRLGDELVEAQRMAGRQPAIIAILRDATTGQVDNGWSVKDARTPTIVWDVMSIVQTEDQMWIEMLAVQRLGGDDG